MSERYVKLFTLPQNLYTNGAPAIIAAGALLKDNQTDTILVQLKIKSIHAKKIKALKVKITPLDTVGKTLGEEIEYQYLDLNILRDAEFGQQNPIPLENDATRSFSARIKEVIFADNSLWSSSDESSEIWETLTTPDSLENSLKDPELTKQYRLKYGSLCKQLPAEEKGLWHCVCGALNHQDEAMCHSCQSKLATLEAVDFNALKSARDERIAAEKKKAQEDKAALDAKLAEAKRLAIKIAPIVVVVIIAGVLLSNFLASQRVEKAYQHALSLQEAGQYEEAIEAFAALEDYKDSVDQITNTVYLNAIAFAEEGEYDMAIYLFTELDDYKDSAQLLENTYLAEKESRYEAAAALMASGDFTKAASEFRRLGDYKDSPAKIEEADLLYQINHFTSFSSRSYFRKQRTNYTTLNGDQIQNLIVGDWRVIPRTGEPFRETFLEDGTRVQPDNTDGSPRLWEVNGQYLRMGSGAYMTEYEVRQISDVFYILYSKSSTEAQMIIHEWKD